MNQLPMSLWNVALEAHSGRIFIGSIATYIFIFVMGNDLPYGAFGLGMSLDW